MYVGVWMRVRVYNVKQRETRKREMEKDERGEESNETDRPKLV